MAGSEFGASGQASWPASLQIVGFAVCIGGFSLIGWTLLTNPFASTAVRIQSDRGHYIITDGPYAWVRHPMYLGVLAFALGTPLALGSTWAYVPVAILIVLFARRTLIEDALLEAELPGYRAYAAKVRWRVVPLLF
jgi:protein-S-isoprenylcysteine O-methyltransferase Ste14